MYLIIYTKIYTLNNSFEILINKSYRKKKQLWQTAVIYIERIIISYRTIYVVNYLY